MKLKQHKVNLFRAAISLLATEMILQSSTSYADIKGDFLIVPGERIGNLTKNLTERQISDAVLPGQYKRALLDIGEGFARCGGLLFLNSSYTLSIFWKDNQKQIDYDKRNEEEKKCQEAILLFEYIESVTIQENAASPWHTKEGIRIGTTIQDIEKINGAPVVFSGFGWDYGGRLIERSGNISEYLGVDFNADQRNPNYKKLMGDQLYRSDNPAAKHIPITVRQLYVAFKSKE